LNGDKEEGVVYKQGLDFDSESVFDDGPLDTSNEVDSFDDRPLPGREKGGGKFQISKTGWILIALAIVVVAVLTISIAAWMKGKEAEKFEEWETSIYEEPPFAYTAEEIQLLRANGYTGDEIEQNELDGVNSDILIQSAADARQALFDKEWEPLFDKASPEFKDLQEHTWVGGEDLDYGTDENMYTYHVYTYNGVYEKIEPKGNQLWVMVTLKNGTHVFFSVTPERYTALDQTGNMVVELTYTNTGDDKLVITNVKEKPIS
jgi:hypothetical protein